MPQNINILHSVTTNYSIHNPLANWLLFGIDIRVPFFATWLRNPKKQATKKKTTNQPTKLSTVSSPYTFGKKWIRQTERILGVAGRK